MHGSIRFGGLLLAVALGACGSNQRYSVSHAQPTAYSPPVAPVVYAPAPGVPAGIASVTFDLSRTDRQSADAAAMRYCGDQGGSAAFRRIDGYAITYDCLGATTPAAAMPQMVPQMSIPSITYQSIGTDPATLQADASRFCARQGLSAVYRTQDGDRVIYDCLGRTTAAMPMATTAAMPLVATGSSGSSSLITGPTITYEMAGDSRQAAETAAIRYCTMQGLTAQLRTQEGRRLTYDCR